MKAFSMLPGGVQTDLNYEESSRIFGSVGMTPRDGEARRHSLSPRYPQIE